MWDPIKHIHTYDEKTVMKSCLMTSNECIKIITVFAMFLYRQKIFENKSWIFNILPSQPYRPACCCLTLVLQKESVSNEWRYILHFFNFQSHSRKVLPRKFKKKNAYNYPLIDLSPVAEALIDPAHRLYET